MSASSPAEDIGALAVRFEQLSLEVSQLRDRVELLEQERGETEFSVASGVSGTASVTVSPSTDTTAGYRVGDHRERVARGIGAWLKRALRGQHRGSSGRDQVALASKVFVVCKDVRDNFYNPPLIFGTRGAAKALCIAQGGEPHDAVFIGLPSKTEAALAIRETGLELPASLNRL